MLVGLGCSYVHHDDVALLCLVLVIGLFIRDHVTIEQPSEKAIYGRQTDAWSTILQTVAWHRSTLVEKDKPFIWQIKEATYRTKAGH